MTRSEPVPAPTVGAIAARVRVDGVRKRALDTGRNRLLVAAALLMTAFAVVTGRLVDLMVLDSGAEPRVASAPADAGAPSGRADIVDRNGVVLATSLPTASLYADPAMVLDAEEAADKLVGVLPSLDRQSLVARLSTDRRFVWIRRNLTPDQQYAVNRLGIPGVAFQRGHRRVYPHGDLVAHVLGFTDVDDRGIAGVEKYFDRGLAGSADPLRLSIDIRVQALMHRELERAVDEFQAAGAAGVMVDVDTGEVLGLVSLPDFDPNDPVAPDDPAAFNRATKGVYEMGSTFKLFTTATALDTGTAGLADGYDATEPIRVARFTINDFHGEHRWLSVPEILIHSSNIGAAKMAVDVGTESQRTYLDALGLLKPSAVELPEVGSPLTPGKWREINTMTVAYGHGIAVSPLQLANGVATLVNGGFHRPATLLRRDGDGPVPGRRVLSEATSHQMRALMRLVVTHGTGGKADAEGYLVGGKTGTAEKQVSGRYERNRRIASFVGAFPIDEPEYALLIVLDEPKGNKSTFNYATGGWVAAPSAKRIVERAGPLLGIEPLDRAPREADGGKDGHDGEDGDGSYERALEHTLASY